MMRVAVYTRYQTFVCFINIREEYLSVQSIHDLPSIRSFVVRQDIRFTSLTNQAADPGFLHIAIESTENAFSFTPTFIPRENPNTTKPQPRPEPHPPPSPPSESISSASIQDLVGALACMFPTSSWAAVAFNVLSND
jgi:hypothetical protein